ncbi:DUF2490 domain-containing protein [Xanthocytophaga flava]|uniref:DUF2490 domain-containing protein n=1 Tax=Xanthocytophaga flava TaxID=3048013 RepID=UPI0028D6FF73|nr:DUF2490 domain-containing protein [Xanthocytophaga flavus]MDJ1471514.1 DUF2490 domain-containing protein [Xanthocytophaga flavus]
MFSRGRFVRSLSLYVMTAGLWLTCISVSYGQKIVSLQKMYWFRYYNQLTISEKFIWHNEIENRRRFDVGTENQLIGHSHLHYNAGTWEPAVGVTLSRQQSYNTSTGVTSRLAEVRPFQEIAHKLKLSKKASLQNKLRVDERFLHRTVSGEATAEDSFVLRLRYRIQLNYQISTKGSLKVSDELFVNTNNGVWYDQNRFYIGYEQALSKTFGLEAGYMHNYWQRKENTYLDRHIVRITLSHRIRL